MSFFSLNALEAPPQHPHAEACAVRAAWCSVAAVVLLPLQFCRGLDAPRTAPCGVWHVPLPAAQDRSCFPWHWERSVFNCCFVGFISACGSLLSISFHLLKKGKFFIGHRIGHLYFFLCELLFGVAFFLPRTLVSHWTTGAFSLSEGVFLLAFCSKCVCILYFNFTFHTGAMKAHCGCLPCFFEKPSLFHNQKRRSCVFLPLSYGSFFFTLNILICLNRFCVSQDPNLVFPKELAHFLRTICRIFFPSPSI